MQPPNWCHDKAEKDTFHGLSDSLVPFVGGDDEEEEDRCFRSTRNAIGHEYIPTGRMEGLCQPANI